MVEEILDDPAGDEAVCAGDEYLSGGDSGHCGENQQSSPSYEQSLFILVIRTGI